MSAWLRRVRSPWIVAAALAVVVVASACAPTKPPPPPPSPCPGCKVYLTFDDGPSVYTPQILSELEAKGVPATFFVLGERAVQFPSDVQQEHADGDGIGDHTWDHPDLTTLPPDQIRQELDSTAVEIANLTGTRPTLWRPPFGAFNDTVTQIASSLGLSMRLWDVDPSDFTMPGTDVIVSTCRRQCEQWRHRPLARWIPRDQLRPLADRCRAADDHRHASSSGLLLRLAVHDLGRRRHRHTHRTYRSHRPDWPGVVGNQACRGVAVYRPNTSNGGCTRYGTLDALQQPCPPRQSAQ